MSNVSLSDLGEHGILNSIVFPGIKGSAAGADGLGDDCALVPVPGAPPGAGLLVTTDPCPRPVAFDLIEQDYWYYGWLTVVINLSDLAAMGAAPAGILISTVMPEEMSARDYERFWAGVVEACDTWQCKILGGNIKDGEIFSADGTALAWCTEESVLHRAGSTAGDLVYVIGEMGLFWAAVLHRARAPELPLSPVEQRAADAALRRPIARVREAAVIAASGLATACIDASDGVLGALQELGRVNRLDVRLAEPGPEPADLVRTVAEHLGQPLRKLQLAWGDWQLVTTIRPESQAEFEKLVQSLGTRVSLVGQMTPGDGTVLAEDDGKLRALANLASERFSERSYFGPGIKAYLDWFADAPIWADQS